MIVGYDWREYKKSTNSNKTSSNSIDSYGVNNVYEGSIGTQIFGSKALYARASFDLNEIDSSLVTVTSSYNATIKFNDPNYITTALVLSGFKTSVLLNTATSQIDNPLITLNTDGTTTIPKLQLNNMMFTTASAPPSYDARRGTVVFNESPNLGGPLGWVSLGDARWANFGIID